MWVVDSSPSLIEQFFINILKAGKIPRHVAVILDGNRRYAAKNNMDINDGHRTGYAKFAEVMRWCRDLNIRELTAYAFSIENFKRTPDEVNFLMTLLREVTQQIQDEIEKIREIGMRVRIFGNLELLPEDIKKMVADIMIITEDCDKFIVNLAISYTSKDELTTTAKYIVKSVKSNEIHPDDIDETLVSQCLLTNKSSYPDVLIRTSGNARLSHFLQWQCGYCIEYFPEVLWPNLSLWHFLLIIFRYQRQSKDIPNHQNKDVEGNARVKQLLCKLDEERAQQIRLFSQIL